MAKLALKEGSQQQAASQAQAGVLIDEDFENASTPRGSVVISDVPDPRREMLLAENVARAARAEEALAAERVRESEAVARATRAEEALLAAEAHAAERAARADEAEKA